MTNSGYYVPWLAGVRSWANVETITDKETVLRVGRW